VPRFLLGLLLGTALGYLVTRRDELRAALRRRHSREDDLAALTKDELYERAKEAEVPGRASMSKGELASALGGQAASPSEPTSASD
jgi:hypothetical protein